VRPRTTPAPRFSQAQKRLQETRVRQVDYGQIIPIHSEPAHALVRYIGRQCEGSEEVSELPMQTVSGRTGAVLVDPPGAVRFHAPDRGGRISLVAPERLPLLLLSSIQGPSVSIRRPGWWKRFEQRSGRKRENGFQTGNTLGPRLLVGAVDPVHPVHDRPLRNLRPAPNLRPGQAGFLDCRT